MEQKFEGVNRDENMELTQFVPNNDEKPSLSSLIKKSEEPSLVETSTNNVEVVEEETELEKAIRAKKDKQTGVEVDPALQQVDNQPLRNIHDSDENREGFADAVSEQEELIVKAKKVVVYNRPENQIQRAEMIDELSACVINEDGSVTVPDGAKYLLARTPEIEEKIAKIKAGEKLEDSDNVYEDVDRYLRQGKKDQIVKILIDKTGLGVNIDFDEEEKKAINESSVIHLVEVDDQELNTVSFEAVDDDRPFLQCIDTYQLSVSKTPMTFVASGFRADVTGMSYGESMDVTMDISEDSEDYITFDKMNRRLSVLYSKIINSSIGKFENYKDFLMKFAYADVEPAVYGLLISTQPEIDEITLKCNGADCNRRFNHKYSPRSLIDFDIANNYYLQRLQEIHDLDPKDNLRYAMNSPVRKGKRFILPRSGYVVDFIMISCYNYLYGLLPYIKTLTDSDNLYIEKAKAEGTWTEDMTGNPENLPKWTITPLLNVVGAVSIKQKDGRNLRFTNMSQIVDILTTLPPDDMKILQSAYQRYLAQFYVGYSLKNVKCPHCGRVTKSIPLTPDELVFMINQRQMDTEIEFDNFIDF